LALTSWGPKT